jgi:hypothetical protein
MKAKITKFDEELVANTRRFLEAAEKNPDSRAVLERFDYSKEEHERGHELVRDAELAFEWERQGKAWNFLSPTPERRAAEARAWHAEAIRRYVQSRLKAAEQAAGWTEGPAYGWSLRRKLTLGTLLALREAASVASPQVWMELRAELAKNLEAARGERPAGAPPPKDTVLVELRGWYERWHLLAHRVFRGRNDLLAPFGLVSGKAPPRLRGKAAKIKYGESAASALPGAPTSSPVVDDDDDEAADDAAASEAAAPKPSAPVAADRSKSLPIVR